MTETEQRNDTVGHWLAGITGLLVALAIGATAGMPVPWGAYSYYWLGWPLMCAVIALITRRYPHRPWRWTMSMVVGQVFAVILLGSGNMVPVALVYAIFLSIPQFVVGHHMSQKVLAAAAGTGNSGESGSS